MSDQSSPSSRPDGDPAARAQQAVQVALDRRDNGGDGSVHGER